MCAFRARNVSIFIKVAEPPLGKILNARLPLRKEPESANEVRCSNAWYEMKRTRTMEAR